MIIGIGCDIVKNDRLKNKEENFINLVLSKDEIIIYNSKIGKQKTQFLAGRFCAKEAIIKALPPKDTLAMAKINIYYKDEKPMCIINDYKIHLSISHEDEYSVAYVIIEKD